MERIYQESLTSKDLLSIQDVTKEEILRVLERAFQFKKKKPAELLKGKLMASCFFEPSTRTRLSFEAAMKRLGGDVIGFPSGDDTSTKKGESLADTMRILGSYVDVIVIRHPLEGSARVAAEMSRAPVINGGDGSNEHPTQTFLDLFTIKECQGELSGLNIVFVGDLKHGRTVHSLALALKHFDSRLFFVSPTTLSIPDRISNLLRDKGIPFSFHRDLEEVIGKADILYMTRIQEERFADRSEYEEVKNAFCLKHELLEKGKKNLKVLHPLPRLKEIDLSVDETPHAYFFEQAENGLYVRQALLSLILSE